MAELAEKIYGEALFQAALEDNKLDKIKAQMDTLRDVFQRETAFLSLMDSPAVGASDKQKMMEETFGGKIEGILYNFLRILCDKRRMRLFFLISNCFDALYRRQLGRLEVEAVTAVPLSEDQLQRLREKLSQLTGKEILLKSRVDVSIIGGVILKYDNREVNGSVCGKLDGLRRQIRGIIA